MVLLTDVFEETSNTYLKYYGLNTFHCFSSPRLSRDEILKMTGVELEFIDDVDMHYFAEEGMRGGISDICKKLSKSNNKHKGNYDANKESKYITYLDANNLYGWTMSQYLPYGKFK